MGRGAEGFGAAGGSGASPAGSGAFPGRRHAAADPGLPGRASGDGFVRLNFATSSAVLTEVCDRMAAALAAR